MKTVKLYFQKEVFIMIERKLYECEYCHTSYYDKKEADKCEKGHVHIKKIVESKYTALKSDQTGKPSKILVELMDGTQVIAVELGKIINDVADNVE